MNSINYFHQDIDILQMKIESMKSSVYEVQDLLLHRDCRWDNFEEQPVNKGLSRISFKLFQNFIQDILDKFREIDSFINNIKFYDDEFKVYTKRYILIGMLDWIITNYDLWKQILVVYQEFEVIKRLEFVIYGSLLKEKEILEKRNAKLSNLHDNGPKYIQTPKIDTREVPLDPRLNIKISNQ